MKKIILLTGLAILIFASCEHEHVYEPYADFGVDYSLVIPGEVVFFTNYSTDAQYYEWDFGDGFTSTDVAPSHYYRSEGTYQVQLAAHNHSYVDYSYLTIEVYKTKLEVEVVQWREDAKVVYIPDIDVTIYDNYTDWYDVNFMNAQDIATTNQYGVVVFEDNLQAIEYYVDVYNDFYNNVQLADEDIDFARTLPLEYAHTNVFTAYVDYDPTGQTILKSTRTRVTEKRGDLPTRSIDSPTKIKDR
ncbi:MAG: PKD domain-containing protein [Bacteroidales bacterium]|nr:PKD domain-containing protein [Bacteroidales bacterium]MBN2820517.1 PKD domain-containing protein [Bacteroidales bacterium]